jgi:hypothetical protein
LLVSVIGAQAAKAKQTDTVNTAERNRKLIYLTAIKLVFNGG